MNIDLKDPTLYATILSITGAILVAQSTSDLRIWGFFVWIISNSIWCGYFFKTNQYNPTVLFIIYLITAIFGVYSNL